MPIKYRSAVELRRIEMKKGFTMAEVLITLGIIAIVAAMTLPSLVQNYQEKVTVNRLKKVYSTLSQLYLLVSEIDGPPDQLGFAYREDGTTNLSGTIQNILKTFASAANMRR